MNKPSTSPSKSQDKNHLIGKNWYHDIGQKLIEGGWRIVPIAPDEKYPAKFEKRKDEVMWRPLFDWQNSNHLPHIYEHAGPSGIGIICGEVVGIDIDILDAKTASTVLGIANHVLGRSEFLRYGQKPKAMILYRTNEPFTKMKIGSGDCAVEILGDGQQLVAFNSRGEGKPPYEWALGGFSPENESTKELITVTREQVIEFLDLVRKELPAKFPNAAVTDFKSQYDLLDGDRVRGDIEALTAAMQYIPNINLHWDQFNRWGMMI